MTLKVRGLPGHCLLSSGFRWSRFFVQQCKNRYLSCVRFHHVALSCSQLSFLPVLPSVLLSMDLSQAPQWSHMDSTSSVWQLRGHPLACVITSSPPSSQFYVFLSSPTAAAVASKVHVPRVCLIHSSTLPTSFICHVHYTEV